MKKIHSITYYAACAVGYVCAGMLCIMMCCGPNDLLMYSFMCTTPVFCVLVFVAWATGTRQ